MIEKDIAAGFPGAVLVVVKDGRVIKKKAYGYSKKYDGNTLLSSYNLDWASASALCCGRKERLMTIVSTAAVSVFIF